jgi:hypothetical protein
MVRKSSGSPAPDTTEETARILFLTYGRDAVEMVALRCAELKDKRDKAGSHPGRRCLGVFGHWPPVIQKNRAR